MPSPGIEPGTHWWKANALTTVPTLLPLNVVSSLPPLSSTEVEGIGFYTKYGSKFEIPVFALILSTFSVGI